MTEPLGAPELEILHALDGGPAFNVIDPIAYGGSTDPECIPYR
jgi:hypothetical protein